MDKVNFELCDRYEEWLERYLSESDEEYQRARDLLEEAEATESAALPILKRWIAKRHATVLRSELKSYVLFHIDINCYYGV